MKFFSRAILRHPAQSIVNAIAQDPNHPKPDYKKMTIEYDEYVKTLQNIGIETFVSPADEAYPDGNFVEDTYFILSDKLVIELNPGTVSRKDEYVSLKPLLSTKLSHLPMYIIPKEFTIDGGDILKDGKTIYVGLSSRTQKEAIEFFESIVSPFGYQVLIVPVVSGLHLKSGMTRVSHKNYVIQEAYLPYLSFLQKKDPSIRYFVVPNEEKHAANVLALNGHIIIPDNCPLTKAYIEQFYPPEYIHQVSTEQARLVDGAITCSSLLLR